jgi:serine/threonine protein kinase
LQKEDVSKKVQAEIFEGLKIYMEIDHPLIVDFVHMFQDSQVIYLVFELCSNGSLKDLLERRRKLTEVEVAWIAKQLLEYFKCARLENLIHRGISLRNILITHDMQLKISTFRHIKAEYDDDQEVLES